VSLDEQIQAVQEKGIILAQNELSEIQFKKLVNLLYRNLDLFATGMRDLVGTDVMYHSIDTGTAEPVRKRAYRQNPEMMREMQRQVNDMMRAGIVEESESPWSSPCLLIKKSGSNEFRFVNDLRAVNKLTKPVYWPMPTINDIFDTVADSAPTIFTNLDLKHAYFQVKMTEDSKPKTAFTVAGKNYQYKRMVMGLSNSAQCWQRLLTKVLSDMLFTSAIVYLDDVLILSRDFDRHCVHLEMVFKKFRDAKLRMNGKKCRFAVKEVKYLGHVLSKSGVAVDLSKTEIITSWPQPKNAKQVRSFLGVTNYYRRFCEGYAQRSAALRELTAKDVPFKWGERQEKAFNDLKLALSSPPILKFPDTNREFYLETDASGSGISYILGQTDDEGRKYVISYGGRGLRRCEKVWPVTQLECLALLTGIRENHVYLASRPFSVFSDHVSLKYLESLKVSANNRLARWALALQPYKFQVHYKEGKKLTAADGISRRPFPEPTTMTDDDDELAEDSFIMQIEPDVSEGTTEDGSDGRVDKQWTMIQFDYDTDGSKENSEKDEEVTGQDNTTACINAIVDVTDGLDIQNLQRACPDFIPIFDYLENGKLPEEDKAARKVILEAEQFVIVDEVLYHLYFSRTKGLDRVTPIIRQLCVPRVLREKLLSSYHDDQCHIGQERLYETLKLKYWFPLMYTSVLAYVRSCEICQRTKTSTHRKRAPLKPLEVTEPFGRVHLDFIGPLPVAQKKYKHLLVVIDSTTLWPEAFATESTSATEVADILFKEIVCRYGVMRQILTDQGSSFRNKLIDELCKVLKIKHTYSSPHHPSGDGKVERLNQTLIKSLRLICEQQTEWVDRLPTALMAYRASVAVPLKTSPFAALFGRQMSLGFDAAVLAEWAKAPDINTYTANLLPKLKAVQEVVQENLRDSGVTNKAVYDRKAEQPSFALGFVPYFVCSQSLVGIVCVSPVCLFVFILFSLFRHIYTFRHNFGFTLTSGVDFVLLSCYIFFDKSYF